MRKRCAVCRGRLTDTEIVILERDICRGCGWRGKDDHQGFLNRCIQENSDDIAVLQAHNEYLESLRDDDSWLLDRD
ncbi:hypothetical protein LD11_gp163 [Bacillus phage Riley]|uniref:Uncharacterized protein n=3 Tax=Bequatrovirus TaxID=1917990 RepID=A0A075M0B3_9CAUD|nr:hypothetical protein LD11_gp163 [Bacillus phage Riley]YP_009206523.1 hypothetical protein AVV02_gp168 [Bacillus phage AvesoBmore]AIF72039.1 hypothetical protein [Bacillus phage Riley]ALA13333.1 hypothetical protein AVESOBMORE_168 [Bacillus phage AvesoBmore]ASZ75895.1 hypothetical protein TAFFO16_162 [Bacillus phage Taffo16]